MVGGLEPGDSAAQGFAGALHINLRVCEPLQAILGALLGFLGAFDVDILGAFGALDQDDGAIRQNFGEAPIDAEEVLHPSPRVIKFAGHEFAQQGSVAGQHTEISALAGHGQSSDGVVHHHTVRAHDVQLDFSWKKISHNIE